MTSRLQGATTKQAPSRATKQGPSRATKQGPMGRVTTSAKLCTALTPSSFSLAWLMSTAAHAGKVIFNNNPFGISHNVTHIHTVQRAAPLPCVVSHCPFQCVCSCSQRKVYDLQCLLGDWTVEGEPDRHIVVVSHGGNLLHLSLHQHHVSR